MHPDRAKKSLYQGKAFNPNGGFTSKEFATTEYAGTKQFGSKSFTTKMFEGAKQSWMGKLLFPEKKLSENLKGGNRYADKKFDAGDFKTKNFSDLDKKSSYSDKTAFATKEISIKGKTQGAIDNDQHLQEAVKKGLSIDEVRNLLNKAP